MAPKVCIKPHEDLFWRLHQKDVFMIFVRENVLAKVAQTPFGQVWGDSSKILLTPKLCLLLHLWWKGTSAPIAPLLKEQRGKCPRHAPILRHPCAYSSTRTLFTRCCRLKCVTVMNINQQRSPKTEQFTTAKISGNALKQGSTTRSVLRHRNSHCKNTTLHECLTE